MSNIDKRAKSVIRELIDDARSRRLGKLVITADEMEALLDELEAETSYREGAFIACNRWHDKFRESESKLEAAEKRITDGENRIRKQNRHVCELFDDNTALRQRIIELEEKLQTADKLQDSAFRHGLQHGFSLGQTDNQAGFEECLLAYSQKEKSNG